MKILNLYAGVGGNRRLWKGCDVTSVENYDPIADIYESIFPEDTLIREDAHQFLLDNYAEFDFIWTSPPCQSHSKMNKATRHNLKRYPEMELYQEIIFLKHFFKGNWVVENVKPYYEPLIPGTQIGRHMFWSNMNLNYVADVERPKGFIHQSSVAGMRELQDWLGIYYEKPVYYKENHDPGQVLRNCVHPVIGDQILDRAKSIVLKEQMELL